MSRRTLKAPIWFAQTAWDHNLRRSQISNLQNSFVFKRCLVKPWWGCGFFFVCLWGGSQTTTPGSETWLRYCCVHCSISCGKSWELKKCCAATWKKRKVQWLGLKRRSWKRQSHHPWKYAALEISDWVLEGGFNEGWLRGFVVIFLSSAFWEFSEFPWQDFLLFYPNRTFFTRHHLFVHPRPFTI